MKKTMKYLLPCAAALMLAACQHKELCYDHSHVVSLNVVFDWSEAPDATPASMSLYLFPKGRARRCVTSSPIVAAARSACPSAPTMLSA